MTTRLPGYSVTQFRDPEAEIARLAQQASLVAEREDAALRALGFPEEGRVLDIGCGAGAYAARLKASRPGLEIVGMDRDPAVIERARAHLEVMEGDAEDPPFPSEHFIATYARFVFRYLPRPEVALSEMRRLLRPSGLAVVIDSDDGALIVSPMPEGLDLALTAKQETMRRRGAGSFFARRIPGLMRKAGFDAIAVQPLAVDSISIGAATFAKVVLGPATQGIDEDLFSRAAAEAAAASITAWVEREDAFGLTTALAVSGRKPGAGT